MIVSVVVSMVAGCASACTAGATRHDPPTSAVAADLPKIEQAALLTAGLLPKNAAVKMLAAEIERQESLIKGCMAKQGFTYYPKPPGSLVDFNSQTDFSSLTYARTYGLGVTSIPTFESAGPANNSYYGSLSQAQQNAYETADSDCADQVVKLVHAEFALDAGHTLDQRVESELKSSQEYTESLLQWSDCAAKVGLRYRSRGDLAGALVTRLGAIKKRLQGRDQDMVLDQEFVRLRSDEISAATATFPCSVKADAVRERIYRSILRRLER